MPKLCSRISYTMAAMLKEDTLEQDAAIRQLRDQVCGADHFIILNKQYTDIQELSPALLRLFIQKIVVHEKDMKWSKHARQTVDIHYNDIGWVAARRMTRRVRRSPRRQPPTLPKQDLPGILGTAEVTPIRGTTSFIFFIHLSSMCIVLLQDERKQRYFKTQFC